MEILALLILCFSLGIGLRLSGRLPGALKRLEALMQLPTGMVRRRGHGLIAPIWPCVAGVLLAAVMASPAHGQRLCPTEGHFLMSIAKHGFDPERVQMVKGAQADRLVAETATRTGTFIPSYDYVLVVERDGYTSVNPVDKGAMCLHWRLPPAVWQAVKIVVFGAGS